MRVRPYFSKPPAGFRPKRKSLSTIVKRLLRRRPEDAKFIREMNAAWLDARRKKA